MSVAANPLADQDWDWRLEAACRSVDSDLFFPLGRTGAAEDQIAAAKGVCWQCPVREQCLHYAVATHQQDGIWGGTSEEERRTLRKTWLAERRRGSSIPPRSGPASQPAGQR